MEKQFYCKKCHKEINKSDKVRPNCGKKTKSKTGCLIAFLIPIVIILLFIIIVLFSDSPTPPTNTTNPQISEEINFKKSKDLSIVIGLTIEEAQSKTGLVFTASTNSSGIENFLADNGNIVIYTDADTKQITSVTVFGNDYNLFGVSNKVKSEKKKEILEANGFSELIDSVYRYKDTYDGLETKPVLQYTVNSLEPLIFQMDTEKAYTPSLSTTIGAIYIGNGQMLEYASDSISELAYEFENLTALQQRALASSYNGTYVKIDGEVTQVNEYGMISVLCSDEEATKEAEEIIPLQAFGNVYLAEEEMSLAWSINKGDKVVIYARIDMDSYQNYMITRTFECMDGILYSYNGEILEAPIISSVTNGIQIPLGSAKSDSYFDNNSNTDNVNPSQTNLSVNSVDAAIEAVKAYGKKEGWSDPYDMYEAHEDGDCYIVVAGHSYLGEIWNECTFSVDKNDKNNVVLVG